MEEKKESEEGQRAHDDDACLGVLEVISYISFPSPRFQRRRRIFGNFVRENLRGVYRRFRKVIRDVHFIVLSRVRTHNWSLYFVLLLFTSMSKRFYDSR